MSASFLAATAELMADVQALTPCQSVDLSDLSIGADDDYDYEQHLMPIRGGAGSTFVERAAPVGSGEDAARAELDDELWAALQGDDGGEEAEAEEAFLGSLLDAQR